MQIKNAVFQSRHLNEASGNQVGLEPILDGGSDRNEDAADPAPDDGYWNQNNQGDQADEYSILCQILTPLILG